MAVRIRKNVWSLPRDDSTLQWYARAIEVMRGRNSNDPTSWTYLAAVHNARSGGIEPPGAAAHWRQCQHQSWYFLPWHRGYLACFEAIVSETIAGLDGPSDWALPYWDYSESLTVQPNARRIPPAFLNQRLPNGRTNWLWAPRAQSTNGDFGFTDDVVSLGALSIASFENSGFRIGFGGPVTGFSVGGNENGALEDVPHNWVHGFVGGQTGFMSFTTTAALDPIFWLHHCNIDRLWEVWRNGDEGRANPRESAWLTGQPFEIPRSTTQSYRFTCLDMLDTTTILHGYRYDSTPVAREPEAPQPVPEVAAMASERRAVPTTPIAETVTLGANPPDLVGSTSAAIALESPLTRTNLEIRRDLSDRFSLESAVPVHVFLHLDGITGLGAPGNFRVLVGPAGVEPTLVAGQFSTFGLDSASDPKTNHGKLGLSKVFEITDIAAHLGLTGTAAEKLEIAFERIPLRPTEEGTAEGLEAFAPPPERPSIQIERINLYFE